MRTSRGIIIGTFLALAGCTSLAQAAVVETTHHKIEAAPELLVESDGGSIEVQPGDAGIINIEARRSAGTREEALALPVIVEKKGNRVRVAFHSDGRNRSVSFSIQAPPDTALRLETGGGAIKVNGFRSGAGIKTGGGTVAVTDTVGKVSIETGGGSISVERADGTLAAETGGGSIHVSASRLSGENRLSTGGGSIDCTIGKDARLKVRASTGGGRARNDFGLHGDSQSFSGAIGDGSSGSLELTTGGGGISLTRG